MINLRKKIKKPTIVFVCVILLAVIVTTFVYTGNSYGNQAVSAMYPAAEFHGQVKIAHGDWFPYEKKSHIPTNRGDVTLKGYFELVAPDGKNLGRASAGTPIAFYFNHINGKISEDGVNYHIFDAELPIVGEDMCGIIYIGYELKSDNEITLVLHNTHKFGNERAIDDLLANLSVYAGSSFEKDMLNSGKNQRTLGFLFILFAFLIIGTALFSTLLQIKYNKALWLAGCSVLFMGAYFLFSSKGIMYWSDIVKFNTRLCSGSIMLYMLSVTAFAASSLQAKTKTVGKFLLFSLTLLDAVLFILAIVTEIKFFDTLIIWAPIQCSICLVMTGFLAHGFSSSEKNDEIIFAFSMVPMIAYIVDVFGISFALWHGFFISAIAFSICFTILIIMILRIVPQNINAAIKAKELETQQKVLKSQLSESRIATMISQIQPHFIYNTLGTIEQLCQSSPESASKLVHNFSLYLRGNFSELDNPKPIRFSKEMEHVKHYTDIEQVRFPDMTIQYDLRSVDFVLPALSVQPLVENAIKHGLMGLEEGGIVTITAYETDSHYIVEVTDDGVGFDSDAGYDETKHVGIKNIRGRIEAMCGGTLMVESKPGQGTKATLKIPREVQKYDSNNS